MKEGDISILNDSSSIHDGIVNVGELDQLPIYIMTNSKSFEGIKDLELASPSIISLREMYNGLRDTFSNYSEQMILHYLYKLQPVNENFSTQDLMKVVMGDEALELQSLDDESKINNLKNS